MFTFKGSNTGSRIFQFVVALSIMTTFIGCKDPDDLGPCSEDFVKAVQAKITDEGENLLITVKDLDFLDNENLVIEDVDLDLKLSGHRSEKKDDDVELSLNGIKVSRRDGGKHCDEMKDDKDDHSNSRGHFKLHKFFLNGAESFESFLKKIKKNNGTLKVGLHGKHVHALTATITFKGKIKIKCTPKPSGTPKPSATPTPIPVIIISKIDSVAPAQSPTSSTSMVINFSSLINNVQFMCSLDSAAFAACSSPKSYSSLTNGSHTFSVYGQDSAGNKEKVPQTYSWVVDSVRPSVSITNLAQLSTLTNQTGISFNLASSEAASFLCVLDNAAPAACSSTQSYAGLTEGAHSFAVTAVDSVGNISSNAASFAWTIDVTAPIASLVSVSPADIISNAVTKSFVFTANETAVFQCSIDHGAYAACLSGLSLNSLAEGNHSIDIRAIDTAGNVGLPASYSWRIDTTAPVLSLGAVSPSQGLTNVKNISVEFFANESVTTLCQLDGAAASNCASPFTASGLGEGAHSLVISATDIAGNQSTNLTLSWVMDFTSPNISFGVFSPSASSQINTSSLSIEVISSKQARLVAALDGLNLSQSQSPIGLSGLSEGNHTLSVYAIDAVGNNSNVISHSFNVDLTAPVVALVASNLVNPTQSDSNTMSFTESEVAPFECQFDGAGFSSCVSPYALSGLANGQHTFEVRATDASGNVSETKSYSWVIDSKAPVTSVVGTQTGSDSVSVNLISDELNTRFECRLDDGMPAVCTSPLILTHLNPGLHFLIVTATDSAGNRDPVGASYIFESQAPIQTVLNSVTPASPLTNINIETFVFSANQSTATFICSMDNAAAAPCQSPYSYTSSADGTHTFQIFAVDQFGAVDPVGVSYTWTVDTSLPIAISVSFSVTTNSITANWTTSKATTSQLLYGIGFSVTESTAESTDFSTTHSVKLVGLTSNSTYSITVAGHDEAGNAFSSGPRTAKTNR